MEAMLYPVTEKEQRKQIKRDRRAIDRARELLGRLNLIAGPAIMTFRPQVLKLAQARIDDLQDGKGGMYPVIDEVKCKQVARDRRTIDRAIDVLERMGVDPDRDDALGIAQARIDSYEKSAGLGSEDDEKRA